MNAVARDSKPMLDENGEKFVEQITPKAFQRAIEKNKDILCLLNHESSRKLGSTKEGNIELFEDNIGLRAICEISDSEVIEKAKNNTYIVLLKNNKFFKRKMCLIFPLKPYIIGISR